MLPMNKLYEDVEAYVRERDEETAGSAVTGMDIRVERDNVVLFSNELSEKYDELVSVELVDTLMSCVVDANTVERELDKIVAGDKVFINQSHLDFLDALQMTGSINLFGARIPLKNRFKELDEFQAKCILSYWMSNHDVKGTKLPEEKKDDVLDHIDDGINLDGEEE